MPKLIVKANQQQYEIIAEHGQNLLEILRRAKILVNSPCNGNGTCGKCKVKILSGYLPEASLNEVKVLGANIKDGYRLSCHYVVQADAEIALDKDNSQAQIVTEGKQRAVEFLPIVTKENIILEKPSLNCQIADFERVLAHSLTMNTPNMCLIRALPELIRKNDYNITLIKMGNELLGLETGDTSKELYGVAVDIGTTTIASYLIDLSNGQRICVQSGLNPQKVYGADVISRIKYTNENPAGSEEMQVLLINEINNSIEAMCYKAGISKSKIYAIALVGNTTMMHFLIKVSAKNIATAPFIPVITSMLKLNATELGIDINSFGIACVFPSVSAYIGADSVAAVLSTGMHQQEEIALLIDIGTNGEIVLGNKDALYACSSAAGPAFEGANIRNGMGSVIGAINSISLKTGIDYTTIGNAEPVGICGTGIVDAVAQMLDIGLIDETGRIDEDWETTTLDQACIADNISVINNMNAFVICGDIAITQKDIRELQNAKAAIAAGINVLIKQAGISFSDINNVYLAGGFGTYINIESALKIGLIPIELRGKIESVGNAAGQGAVEGLISQDSINQTYEISKKIKYIELSSSKDFNDLYIDCMMFE